MAPESNLFPGVYDELRRLANARLAALPPGQTLQPTALVHEVYLRLADRAQPIESTRHFFFAAARAMHDILVDRARQKASLKRGGDRQRADQDPSDLPIAAPTEDVLALDEALKRLEADDPRKGQIVNLRFFAGLTIEETAAVLGVSHETVKREWRYIKTWLYSQLADDAPDGA